MSRRGLAVMVVSTLALAGCEKSKSAPAPEAPVAPVAKAAGPALGPEVRARVNGVPITGEQLLLRLAGQRFGPRAERATAEDQAAALQQAILAELQAQKALSLGFNLDVADGGSADPRAIEFRRHELAKQYRLRELLERSKPSPAEVRAYFENNKQAVQTEFEVQLISFDARSDGEAFVAAVRGGRPFDEVAQHLYPAAPEPRPWAARTIAFAAVPPRFAAALGALGDGDTSGFIPDLGDRGWVLKLVSKKVNPAVTFEAVEPALTALIQEGRFEQRRVQDERELRAAATIELVPNAP